MRLIRELIEDFNRHKNYDLANPGTDKVAKVSTPEEIAEIISTHASDMVAAYRSAGSVLYRGMKTGDAVPNANWDTVMPAFVITGIRQDRKPLEMRPERHSFLHKAFLALGLKATRTNSIFCTAREVVAHNWGAPHIIFVKNGWSATVFDKITNDYVFYELEDLEYDTPEEQRFSTQKIKKLKPRNIETPGELSQILKKKYYDVLVTGDSYIALKVGAPETDKVLKLLKVKAR